MLGSGTFDCCIAVVAFFFHGCIFPSSILNIFHMLPFTKGVVIFVSEYVEVMFICVSVVCVYVRVCMFFVSLFVRKMLSLGLWQQIDNVS